MEQTILSSLIHDSSNFDSVHSIIETESFYMGFHQRVFASMQELSKEQKPFDDTFIKRIIAQDEFDEQAFTDIIASSPSANIISYAQELADLHTKRRLANLTTEIQKLISDTSISSEEIMDNIQQFFYKILIESSNKSFKHSKEIVLELTKLIEENKEKGTNGIIGVDTGFKSLNRMTAGFSKGDMIIVAARPSMGKTALVLAIVDNILRNNQSVAFFSLEMPAEQLLMRMISARTSIDLQSLRIGDLSDEQWQRYSDATNTYSQSDLFIDDDGLLNITKLRSKLRDLKSRHPEVCLAVIDYIQLMSGNSNKDRHLEVAEISRGIKMLARELDMPIIALSQLNRSLESRSDKRPMLSDLRESGSIEQDADMIMFVYRDDVYKEHEERQKQKKAAQDGESYKPKFIAKEEEEAELIIGKHRNGPTGVVELIFHKKFTRFVDKEQNVEQRVYKTSSASIPITIDKDVSFD